ncbi:hypothetical protein J1N35_044579 [Gossypium stocksii]|uniref:Endonuclease/exonuclease/phosphatase domain-containing protein n=1 Tax=Gossypium stocksii TaxID=47602 RepID=A0A9D3ZG32_9ROSI|nr:hypothetical protein J1N35_044579 [Gossypium stocksii]
MFIEFYGSPYTHSRKVSWDLLRNLSRSQGLPWMVCGDFNKILYSFKNVGSVPKEEKRMVDFRDVLVDYQLIDVGYLGTWFIWEEGICRRLIFVKSLTKEWLI